LFNPAGFVISDGCITLIQFYLGVLVIVYLLCLFCITNFDVLLMVQISIFILVLNQLDAQNFCFTVSLFHSLYMFRARTHHQEVKIALHSLWYHHTETSEWSKITKIQFYKYEQNRVYLPPPKDQKNYQFVQNYEYRQSVQDYNNITPSHKTHSTNPVTRT